MLFLCFTDLLRSTKTNLDQDTQQIHALLHGHVLSFKRLFYIGTWSEWTSWNIKAKQERLSFRLVWIFWAAWDPCVGVGNDSIDFFLRYIIIANISHNITHIFWLPISCKILQSKGHNDLSLHNWGRGSAYVVVMPLNITPKHIVCYDISFYSRVPL